MSGKVPSRVRIARTQRNTPKYAGNMNKEGLISCGFGRNKVLCQYVKRRTRPAAAKITLKQLKLFLLNTIKANALYDTVITVYKTTAQNTAIVTDDLSNDGPYAVPQNYALYSTSVYPVSNSTPNSSGFHTQSSIDIDLSDAQVGDKYRFIISSYNNSGFAGQLATWGNLSGNVPPFPYDTTSGPKIGNDYIAPNNGFVNGGNDMFEFDTNWGIKTNYGNELNVNPTDLPAFFTFGDGFAPQALKRRYAVFELELSSLDDGYPGILSFIEPDPVTYPALNSLYMINTLWNNTTYTIPAGITTPFSNYGDGVEDLPLEENMTMILYTSPTADPIISNGIDNDVCNFGTPSSQYSYYNCDNSVGPPLAGVYNQQPNGSAGANLSLGLAALDIDLSLVQEGTNPLEKCPVYKIIIMRTADFDRNNIPPYTTIQSEVPTSATALNGTPGYPNPINPGDPNDIYPIWGLNTGLRVDNNANNTDGLLSYKAGLSATPFENPNIGVPVSLLAGTNNTTADYTWKHYVMGVLFHQFDASGFRPASASNPFVIISSEPKNLSCVNPNAFDVKITWDEPDHIKDGLEGGIDYGSVDYEFFVWDATLLGELNSSLKWGTTAQWSQFDNAQTWQTQNAPKDWTITSYLDTTLPTPNVVAFTNNKTYYIGIRAKNNLYSPSTNGVTRIGMVAMFSITL